MGLGGPQDSGYAAPPTILQAVEHMTFTRHAPLFLVAGLAAGLGCSTPGEGPGDVAMVSEEALPEIRYYVIADT